jgi:putative redox protein
VTLFFGITIPEGKNMSVQIFGRYQGALRVKLTHEPSGAEITTVAPKDNNGDGSLFSPTDLLVASLGSCMATVMAIVARREGVELELLDIDLVKYMVADPLRRVGKIDVAISLPPGIADDLREKLKHAALTCPVKVSLSDATVIDVVFS